MDGVVPVSIDFIVCSSIY